MKQGMAAWATVRQGKLVAELIAIDAQQAALAADAQVVLVL